MVEDSAARASVRSSAAATKGAATRQHILETSSAVFARVGYDRARMSELVGATGLTKGAVYFHFDSKEALAVAVLEAKHAAWLADVKHHLDRYEPGRDRLTQLLPAMVDLHSRDETTWAISRLTRNLAEFDQTRPCAVALMTQWVDFVAGMIRDAQERGHSPLDLDPSTVAVALIGAFDGIKSIHDTLADSGAEPFMAASVFLHRLVLDQLLD